MPVKTSCEIRCVNCGKWFRSEIQFGQYKSFTSGYLAENLQSCPHCRMMTACNKENMRFIEDEEEGNKTHFEGKDTF